MRRLFYVIFVSGFVISSLIIVTRGSFAQEQNTSDVPVNLQALAKDLNCSSREECRAAFDSNFTEAVDLANRHRVYDTDAAKKQLASSFKKEVLEKLSNVADAEVEEKIVAIASDLIKSKPALARQFGVDNKRVEAVKTIITEVKNAGGNIDICTKPANTLTREQLQACINAAEKLSDNHQSVITAVPLERISAVKTNKKMAELEQALNNGTLKCGDNTLEGCGTYCLNPPTGAITIPAVCMEIAQQYFGEAGVVDLKNSYERKTSIERQYKTRFENLTFTTSDGKTLTGRDAIKDACDAAFDKRDIGLARLCGEFATRNGFATQDEVTNALKIMETFVNDANTDFDDCVKNPRACERFIPEQQRKVFDSGARVFEIMAKEMGFSPDRCEQEGYKPEIGQKCLEGAQRALPQIEALAQNNPAILPILTEIKQHIAFGKEQSSRKEQVKNSLENAGGPGGCKSEQECFSYCSDPQHGAECIAFGARNGIFRKDEVVQKFETFNMAFQDKSSPQSNQPRYQDQQYPPSNNQRTDRPYEQSFATPSPACMTAIQTGDFVRAKELCQTSQIQPSYIPPPQQPDQQPYVPPLCPQYSYTPCPQGQYREQSRDEKGCPTLGVCVPFKTIDNQKIFTFILTDGKTITTSDPKVAYEFCQKYGPGSASGAGEKNDAVCRAIGYVAPPPCTTSFTGYSLDEQSQVCRQQSGVGCSNPFPYKTLDECTAARVSRDTTDVLNPTPPIGSSTVYQQRGSWTQHVWKFNDGQTEQSYILSRTDKDYSDFIAKVDAQCLTISRNKFAWKPNAGNDSADNWQYFGIPDCSGSAVGTTYPTGSCSEATTQSQCGVKSGCSWQNNACFPSGSYTSSSCDSNLIALLGSGCHYMYKDSSGNEMYCDGSMTKSAKRGDTATQAGCFNPWGNTSTSTTTSFPGDTNSCPWFAYNKWDRANKRYCQLNSVRSCSLTYPEYLTQSNYKAESCPTEDSSTNTNTTSGQCSAQQISLLGSGCHWMSNGFFNSEMTKYIFSGDTTNTVKECSTAYIIGCSSSSQTAGACASGQWWDPATQSCKSSSTSNYQSCPSGQWWDSGANSCRSSTTSTYQSCPSGQYWDSTVSACRTNSAYTTQSCSSDQYWDTATQSCKSSNYQSCPSGQWWDSAEHVCKPNTTTSSTSCPSGQYWNGSSCVSSTAQTTPSCGSNQWWDSSAQVCRDSCPSGQYWDSSSSSCKSSQTTSSSQSCPAGQYWSGSSCVNNTTQTCSSNQYWNGSTCVNQQDPSTACAQAGGTWNGSTCQMPTSGSSGNATTSYKPRSLLGQLLYNFFLMFSGR